MVLRVAEMGGVLVGAVSQAGLWGCPTWYRSARQARGVALYRVTVFGLAVPFDAGAVGELWGGTRRDDKLCDASTPMGAK